MVILSLPLVLLLYSYVVYNGAEHKIETNSPNETLKGQESQLAGDQPTGYLQALPRDLNFRFARHNSR